MAEKIIYGIQQLGVGVSNVHEAFAFYRKYFGMDIKIFEEAASAELMLPYTGGQPRERHAILAVNIQGGGGFEIWQYRGRTSEAPKFELQLGDLGMICGKIKCKDVAKTHAWYTAEGLKVSSIYKDPAGNEHFFLTDPYNNVFQLVATTEFYMDDNKLTGGVHGVVIGVSDIDKASTVYGDILGYDEVVYQKEGEFEDLKYFAGGDKTFKRISLRQTNKATGGFSGLFGNSEIELVQVKDREPKKIFEGRLWGDLGFIHLCFDIHNMQALKAECEAKGQPFTVDSFAGLDNNKFDMGEAAGHFSYIEDSDGTLIEFVETLKVPIMKKIGWYLNMEKRNPKKNLPNFIVKALRMSRVKD